LVHRVHHSPLEQTVIDLNAAFEWLSKSTYTSEAKPLVEMASKKRRGTISTGELLLPLMIRPGVQADKTLESQSSEAWES